MKVTIETKAEGIKEREYSDKFEEILASNIFDIADHFFNDIEEKHRKVLDRIVEKETDRNPKKLSIEAKHDLIKDIPLESAKERTIRIEREVE